MVLYLFIIIYQTTFIMKRILICTVLSIIFSITAFAQKTLTGKVTDAATGNSIAGVTITYAGKAVTTDNTGNFSVPCTNLSFVLVSHIGYETKRVAVKNCDDVLTVSLSPVAGTLGEVEVTATSNLNKSILYQPSSIAKLTPVELKRSTGLFFDDIINVNVPGVSFERRTVSAGQQFNIRGYGNGARGTRGTSSNFDGQGYKVYLNGIPVTDAEGITVMDDLDFGSIGNVEVSKGPAGTLYGLAIAGAVNLRTVTPEKGKTSLSQEVLIGDYGLQRYTTQFQTAGDHSSLLVNYGHQKSDGYFIHNASKKDFVNVISTLQPKEKQQVTIYAGFTNSYDERGGEQTIAQFEAKSDTGNFEYVKRNGHSRLISYRAGVGHNYEFNNWLSNFTTVFGTGLVSDVSSAGGWTDKLSLNYGTRSAFQTKFNLANDIKLSGLTGFELQRQNASTIGYNMKASPFDATPGTWTLGEPYWVINANTANTATVSSTASFFTEWTLALPKSLSFTAGIGSSKMRIHLEDRFNPATATKPATFDTTYKKMYAPHFAVNKVFNKNVSVYASYSTGFKAPVSANFFVPVAAVGPNPAAAKIDSALKPEKAVQYELGTKGSLLGDKLFYEVTVFNAIYTDKMTSIAVKNPNDASGVTLYAITANGGKQNHKGLEALLKYTLYQSATNFIRAVRPFANLTYSDFKYKDFKFHQLVGTTKDSVIDYSGRPVAGVPKLTYNLGLDFELKYGIYGNVTYAFRDKMSIISTEEFYTKKYALLNSKIGFRQTIAKQFDLDFFVGVNNMTNTQYAIKVFVNQLTTPLSKTAGDAYIPGPGKANAYAGLNLKYNF
jgi:iron complex outermembrane recepter protein